MFAETVVRWMDAVDPRQLAGPSTALVVGDGSDDGPELAFRPA
jgi:hypothetical protein